MDGMTWIELIHLYYSKRGLKEPDANQSLDWCLTELAEAKELLLTREGGWIRNNPGNHPKFDKCKFAEELGDIIMMALRAGMAEGVDPLAALSAKIDLKLSVL